jgi:hypothetical protein
MRAMVIVAMIVMVMMVKGACSACCEVFMLCDEVFLEAFFHSTICAMVVLVGKVPLYGIDEQLLNTVKRRNAHTLSQPHKIHI